MFMKKRVLAAICSFSILLTGCSLPFGNNADQNAASNTSIAGGSTEASNEASSEASTEASSEASSDASAEASSDAAASASSDSDNKFGGTLTEASDEEMYTLSRLYKIVTYENYTYDDDKNITSRYSFESLMLIDDCKESNPDLYKTLYDLASDNGKTYKKYIEDFTDYAERNAQYKPEEALYYTVKVCPQRTADQYLSYYEFVEDNYSSDVLSSGIVTFKYGHTYDIYTGEVVKLSDVVTCTPKEFAAKVYEELTDAYPNNSDWNNAESDIQEYVTDSSKEYNWYFGVDGIHIVFNPGCFFSCNAYYEIVIEYNDEIVNKDYVYNPEEGYAYVDDELEFINDKSFSGTGLLSITYTQSKYHPYLGTAMTVTNGSKSATFDNIEFDINRAKIYHMVTAESKEYLYVFTDDDTDKQTLYVFDVSGKDIKAVGSQTFNDFWLDEGSGDYAGEPCFMGPDSMISVDKTNVFGTISYYFPATVSADGMPTKLTARCRILECSDKITAKEDIKASEVDKDGNVINESVTVFEDSVVQPVYVDPEHFVDCLLEDGTVVRFEFTFEEDKVFVDGEDVNEIFDGLVYEDEE